MKNKLIKILLAITLLSGCAKTSRNTIEHSHFNTYFFEQYSKEEQEVYDIIYTALSNKQSEVNLDNTKLEMNKVFEIAERVSDDHPEFFYFYGDEMFESTDYYIYKDATLTLKFAYDIEAIEEKEAVLNRIKGEYLSQIHNMNQIEVLEYTYQYLIELIEYDFDVLESLPDALEHPDPYGLVGALINHKCVCSGYAKAFQYLINAAGYDCLYIRGFLQGESHGWNSVKINDQYYHFDVTSDDNDDTDQFPLTFYQYFGLNTTQILQDHIIDTYVTEVEDLSQNYHVMHGHYIDSMDKIDSVLESQRGNEVITVQCSDYDLFLEVKDHLIQKGEISKYYTVNTIRYVMNEKLFMIQFYI